MLQCARPLPQALLRPLRRSRGLVLHDAAMAQRELVRLRVADLLLLLAREVALALELLRALGDAGLAFDAVVGFVAAAVKAWLSEMRTRGGRARRTACRLCYVGCGASSDRKY